MNKNILILSNFYFKGTHVMMYVKTVDQSTRTVKYTKDKHLAIRFGSVESAENFIALFKPQCPQILFCHDVAPNALRYSAADAKATTELMREIYHVKKEKDTMLPEIKNVIYNNPATIVFWTDGTKTVVKCQKDETYDPEKGLAMAIAKKALGNKYDYYNTIKHWLKKAPKVKTSKFYCNGVEYSKTVKED